MSAAVADRQPSDRRGGRLKRSEAAEEAQVAAGSADQTSRRSRGRGSKGQTEAHKAISGDNVPGVLQVEESTTEPVGRRRQTRVAAGVKSGDVDLQKEAIAPPPQHQPDSPPLLQPVASTEVETSSRMGRRKRVTGGNEKKENSTSSVAEQENSVERVSSGTGTFKSSVKAEHPSDEDGKRARGRPLKNSRERMGEEQPTTTPIDGSSGTRSVRSAGGRSTTSLRSEASVASSSSSTSTITKKPTAKRSRVANTTQETEIPRVEEDEEMAGKRKRGRGKTPQSEAATAKRKYRSEPASSESETTVGR